jgi:hypothetical protein
MSIFGVKSTIFKFFYGYPLSQKYSNLCVVSHNKSQILGEISLNFGEELF